MLDDWVGVMSRCSFLRARFGARNITTPQRFYLNVGRTKSRCCDVITVPGMLRAGREKSGIRHRRILYVVAGAQMGVKTRHSKHNWSVGREVWICISNRLVRSTHISAWCSYAVALFLRKPQGNWQPTASQAITGSQPEQLTLVKAPRNLLLLKNARTHRLRERYRRRADRHLRDARIVGPPVQHFEVEDAVQLAVANGDQLVERAVHLLRRRVLDDVRTHPQHPLAGRVDGRQRVPGRQRQRTGAACGARRELQVPRESVFDIVAEETVRLFDGLAFEPVHMSTVVRAKQAEGGSRAAYLCLLSARMVSRFFWSGISTFFRCVTGRLPVGSGRSVHLKVPCAALRLSLVIGQCLRSRATKDFFSRATPGLDAEISVLEHLVPRLEDIRLPAELLAQLGPPLAIRRGQDGARVREALGLWWPVKIENSVSALPRRHGAQPLEDGSSLLEVGGADRGGEE